MGISKCKGDNCPKKETCYRYTSPVSDWQSWIEPELEDCDNYWATTGRLLKKSDTFWKLNGRKHLEGDKEMLKIKVSEKEVEAIKEAAELANQILNGNNEAFNKELIEFNDFTYTRDSGYQALNRLKACEKEAEIKLYRAANPWSSVMGYTKGKDIYFNKWKLPRSCASLVETIVHEYGHIVAYSHGGNKVTRFNRNKKYKSVPYFIGRLARRIIESDKNI